jgi:hypothetical protein
VPPRLVECTIPVLPVSDMRRAIQFYNAVPEGAMLRCEGRFGVALSG